MGDGLRQDRPVEGADGGNVQPRRLLEDGLDLGAVLAHDVEVVAPGLAVPVLLRVQGAELAEGVRAEEDLLRALIAHHDLRPVDHGGGDEVQHVAAQGELVPLLHREGGGEVQPRKVLPKEREGLGSAHEFYFRPALHHRLNAGGVVGLDVVDDEVVRLPAGQGGVQIVQELRALVVVHGVQDGHLLVQDHVGIVGHAVGDHILALEKIDVVIVDADIADAVRHRDLLLASDVPPERQNFDGDSIAEKPFRRKPESAFAGKSCALPENGVFRRGASGSIPHFATDSAGASGQTTIWVSQAGSRSVSGRSPASHTTFAKEEAA